MIFQTPSYIQTIRTLVDGGIKLDIITRELPPEQAMQLFTLKGKEGFFLFSENDIQEKDIPKEQAVVTKKRMSDSQEFRLLLKDIWETKLSADMDFDEYYKQEYRKIKQHYIEKYLPYHPYWKEKI